MLHGVCVRSCCPVPSAEFYEVVEIALTGPVRVIMPLKPYKTPQGVCAIAAKEPGNANVCAQGSRRAHVCLSQKMQTKKCKARQFFSVTVSAKPL